MIKPTIGRVVLVKNRPGNFGQDEPALICYVHSDTLINVGGFDGNGNPFSLTSLTLMQDGIEPYYNPSTWAEWMPYQKGQAAKTEALEAQINGNK